MKRKFGDTGCSKTSSSASGPHPIELDSVNENATDEMEIMEPLDEVGGDGDSGNPPQRKGIPRRAKAWNHFDLIKDKDGKPRAKCKYCDKSYAADSSKNGTFTMNNHMKSCKEHPDNVNSRDNQPIVKYCQNVSGSSSSNWKFDQYKSHLTRITHQQNLILITPSHSIHTIADIKDDAVSRKLENLPDNWTRTVGSCNGLVLLMNDDDDKFLLNPVTQQHVKIPNSPLALKSNESFSMHGFGYDHLGDDYKVVTLSYYDTDNEYEPDCADTFVDVYSVKSDFWNRVQNSPFDHAVPKVSSGAFVNGAIHWLASSRKVRYTSVITAFDLVGEAFSEIPPPSGVDVGKFVFYELVVVGGCLCMIDDRREFLDVWIMKDYGLAESWTKLSIFYNDFDCDYLRPLCFIGDEELVLITEEESNYLVVYDVKEGILRDLVVDGVQPAMFIDGVAFVESLVSLPIR